MEIIYAKDCLVVTKSDVDGTYQFHFNRIPLLMASAEGMKELADAIYKTEGSESGQDIHDMADLESE